MNADKLAASIAAKELRGESKTSKSYAWLFGVIPVPYEITSVRIDDSREALARYLIDRGDDVFEPDALLILTREE